MCLQPKYWCKHCKTFVRDTKLERTNHEATPKHQGNIKRFLRDLHRGHEKDEREKQRAKDEVERLNGVVSGAASTASGSGEAPWKRKSAMPPPTGDARQATPAERKAQLAQLAAMGVAVPEDFRREMAMAGDWQTVSETPVYEDVKKEEEDTKDIKSSMNSGNPTPINIGVRKRKFEGQEEEEEAGEKVMRKGWGSTTKAYPGANTDLDLDALLRNVKPSAPADPGQRDNENEARQSTSLNPPDSKPRISEPAVDMSPDALLIKREDSVTDEGIPDSHSSPNYQQAAIKHEDDASTGGIVFKKRKAKPMKLK